MSYSIDKVINIALGEKGYLEKASNANLDSKTANAGRGNYTKYWRDVAPGMQGSSWCQCFVDWCFIQAYGLTAAKKLLHMEHGLSYYTPTCAGYFSNAGQAYKTPAVGDIIYFKNSSRIHHVGIIYKVDASYVYTIEGNTSSSTAVVPNGGGVFCKKYLRSNRRIACYCRPNYGAQTTTPIHTPTPAPAPISSASSKHIKTGQKLANKWVNAGIAVDGLRGPATRKAAAMVLQKAMNLDYKAGLAIDGAFGPASKKALGKHYVAYGERQYMVTAAEILQYLLGKDPRGVEYPGKYGNGLAEATHVRKITANMFLSYLN